jgi:hypothetical protein
MDTTYRLKAWYLLLNLLLVLIALSMLAGAIAMLLLVAPLIVFLFRQGQTGAVIFLGIFEALVAISIPLLIVLGIVFPIGNARLSYLRVGPSGLELRVWPSYRLQCDWHQVTGLEDVIFLRGLLCLPMIRFKEARIESWRKSKRYIHLDPNGVRVEQVKYPASFWLLDALLLWSVNERNLIPVYIFAGWPDGRLRRELETRLGPIVSQ